MRHPDCRRRGKLTFQANWHEPHLFLDGHASLPNRQVATIGRDPRRANRRMAGKG